MHPLLSKLTTCVCAAGTGAAVLPTAHAIQRHYAPHHIAHHAKAVPAAALVSRSDCLPGAALAGAALTSMTPLGLDGGPAAAAPVSSEGFPFGPPAGVDRLTPASTGGGGAPGGFGGGYDEGGGGNYGGGGAPGQPGGPSPSSPPTGGSSNPSALPEPASWALMVIGFGTLGGALRLRQSSVGKGEIVEV